MRVAPSRRSVAVGLGIVVLSLGAYAIARETSLFAVRAIDVRGGSPQLDAQVRGTLSSFVGRSLVGFDGAAALQRVDALPGVVRATYDRAFPHTLVVSVVPERPSAVLRQGAASWLVSTRARVLRPLPSRALPTLPRIWLPASASIRLGATLDRADGGAAARALGLAGAFATRVLTASYANGSLVFHLRSGIALELGSSAGVRLKVAVASQTLPLLPTGSTYLDVSVPGRPVAGTATAASSTATASTAAKTSAGAPAKTQSSTRG